MDAAAINRLLGNMDLWLLEQFLKGHFHPEKSITDLGCGEGRNLHYFLQQGWTCRGVDKSPLPLVLLRKLAKQYGAEASEFLEADLVELPYDDGSQTTVICSNVLQHLNSAKTVDKALQEMGRVLHAEGTLFLTVAGKDWPSPRPFITFEEVDTLRVMELTGTELIEAPASHYKASMGHWWHIALRKV